MSLQDLAGITSEGIAEMLESVGSRPESGAIIHEAARRLRLVDELFAHVGPAWHNSETMLVPVADELVQQMKDGWSEPLLVRIEQRGRLVRMVAKRVEP